MIELLFSDSAAGSMQCAKSQGNGRMINGVAEVITMDCEGNTSHESFQPEPYNGPKIEGSPEDIAAIAAAFDIGDISDLSDWKARMKLLQSLWAVYEDDRMDDENWCDQEAIRAQNLVIRLQKAAVTGESVRIWWSDAPNDTCGFYWAMSILQSAVGTISSIKIPSQFITKNGYIHFNNTGELSPSDFSRMLAYEQEIPADVRKAYAFGWNTLVMENSPLRAVINGTLSSVPVNFYDFTLTNTFPRKECLVAEVIGRALSLGPGGVSDWWLANRLKGMINSGEVILTNHKAPFYSSKVVLRT